ncbi:MAG: ABC transporter ATP-binding protein [Oscillospiraceae bacterium]|nr:ABC transporter ATP-binding protein [Oscillospiraceae bacterium]
MILQMTDICKDYPMGKTVNPVLKHVNLTVNEGDYLAIMGPSGSGKTTLMNLIGCLDVPTSGSYVLGDKDITKCSSGQLSDIRNREIGFVFQSFHLLPKMTALDNVALPLLYAGVSKAERRQRAREALETVGLGERVDFMPDQLSGGQSQRVAIARAIVNRPRLLLADEPTGALDSASGEQVMKLFESLHEGGSTIIMITHDSGVAKKAHDVRYIRDGILSGGEGIE